MKYIVHFDTGVHTIEVHIGNGEVHIDTDEVHIDTVEPRYAPH